MFGVRQILLNVFNYFRYSFPKYKIYILVSFVIIPISDIIYSYFHGKFVKKVEFYGININYFKFLLVSFFLSEPFVRVIRRYSEMRIKKKYLFDENLLVTPISRAYISLLKALLRNSYFILLLSLFFDAKKLIIIILFSFLFPIFSLHILFVLLSINSILRRERIIFSHLVWQILRVVIPVQFSFIQILPRKVQEIFLLIPPISVYEILRRSVILEYLDCKVVLSIPSLIILTALSFLIFNKVLEKGRREGWIWLE